MAIRLAIITTHPIQYHAPVFRALAARKEVEIFVFYNWEGATGAAYDRGFGRMITWDIPLLEGYPYAFVPNESKDPGTHHFNGLHNPELVPSVDAWNPDAVLVIGWNYRSHLRALRAFHGRRPVFFRGDSTLLDERPGIKRQLRRSFLTRIYRHVDVALYVGANNKSYFKAHGLQDEQLAWVPHAVDNKRFQDSNGEYDKAAAQWRCELGIPRNALAVLFAGKLESKKAPELLLQAVLDLSNPAIHLVFAGSGHLEPTLREMAGDHEGIHFIGFQNQSQMPIVYRLGDIFVLPSRGPGETWGLAINEALASSRPVIVSDRVGCAPDLVEEGENGYVFSSGDRDALRKRLDCLVKRPDLLKQMGKRSSDLIEAWSIDVQVDRIVQALQMHV